MPPQVVPIRILILGDRNTGVDQALREIERTGRHVETDFLASSQGLEGAVAMRPYDLVVDCRAGRDSGLKALRTLAAEWTDQAKAEAAPEGSGRLFSSLIARSPAGIFRSSVEGRFLEVNSALVRMAGLNSPAELLARPAQDFWASAADREALMARLQAEGSIGNVELRLKRADGTPGWVLATLNLVEEESGPVLEGMLIDITDRKRDQQRIDELNRLYAVLSHVGQAIARIDNACVLFAEVCRIAVQDGGFRMAWVGLVNEGTRLVEPVKHYGLEEGYLERIRISVADEPEGRGPTGSALREGRHAICNDIRNSPYMLPWRAEADARGYRSSGAFPLRVQGRLVGALTVYGAEPGFFDEHSIALMGEVAASVSFALESLEREAQRNRAEQERARLYLSEQTARAEAAAEARFRELLEAAPDPIIEVDAEGRIILLNPATERLFGYSREELLNQPLEILIPESSRSAHVHAREAYMAQPSERVLPADRRVHALRKDGTEFPVEVRLNPVRSGLGDRVTCIVRDITERCRAEQALRDSAVQMAATLESITDAFFALDREWRFTYVNHRAEQVIGRTRDRLLGRSLWQEFPELAGTAFEQQYTHAAASLNPVEFSALYPPTGIWAEVHAYPSTAGLSVYLQDVTGRKHLEEQFRQSQKLEALGRLAGGVAHDFNNLLTIIGGYGQMALDATESRNPLRRDIEAIVEAAERASALTRQLLAFSRRQMVQTKILDPNRVVSRMEKMLRRLIGEDVELRLDLQSDVGRIKIDPGQIEQVIMNLAINSRDAMPHGGTLTIMTTEVVLPAQSGLGPSLPPGGYVVLAVSDTGTGMDAEVRSRIFEPFFTTKPKGKGTGLGLSTVYGIVKQAGGEVWVDTELGKGTTFSLYLPKQGGAARLSRGGRKRPARKGTETILLVEDELEVRKLACHMLARQGYKVLDAANAAEALHLWATHSDKIDLLLTDVVMPGMNGRQLAEKLASERPSLRVLYVSGYNEEITASHGVLQSTVDLLPKPFTPESLGTRVRTALDRK